MARTAQTAKFADLARALLRGSWRSQVQGLDASNNAIAGDMLCGVELANAGIEGTVLNHIANQNAHPTLSTPKMTKQERSPEPKTPQSYTSVFFDGWTAAVARKSDKVA